eukprot:gene1213-590_t
MAIPLINKFRRLRRFEIKPFNNVVDQSSFAYRFLPFSRGPRMCIGYRFAELELKTVLAKLLRSFTFKLAVCGHAAEEPVPAALESLDFGFSEVPALDRVKQQGAEEGLQKIASNFQVDFTIAQHLFHFLEFCFCELDPVANIDPSKNLNRSKLHLNKSGDLGIQILAINETKLDGSIADDLVGVQGYSIKRCDRNRNGGGVAIYVKDNLFDKYTIRDDVPVSSIEAVCVECKPSHSAPFIILALYRPPDESVEFFSELKKTLHFLDNENKELILLGDTNCDILAEYSSNEQSSTNSLPAHSKRLLEIYSLFGFQQLIRKAYRNLRNRANKMKEHLKREFFTKKIAEHDGDLKNTWKTINQILNKKSKTTHISSLRLKAKQYRVIALSQSP